MGFSRTLRLGFSSLNFSTFIFGELSGGIGFIESLRVVKGLPAYGLFFIAPEDLAQAFTTIYGFAPRILKGNDHRVGFGFRFGNHADLQVLYEFGPQTNTRPLQATLIRSAPFRQRQVRRPFIEFLIRAGILQTPSYELNIIHDAHDDDDDDGPR